MNNLKIKININITNSPCKDCMFFNKKKKNKGTCLYPNISKKDIGSENCENFIPNISTSN